MENNSFEPYYAVIFTSKLKEGNQESYRKMAQRMEELAEKQEGYLGIESAKEGIGITVSYWKDLTSIQQWKQNSDHIQAQELGKRSWYEAYTIRIAKVEKEYKFD
ncbi:MAG: antibiotic biosynthesis monooxygenase [Flavobacteriales bacterium]|nr:antibiotic biosynthesis monooxygenase [Flavobacteriales bacterium]